MTGPFPTPFASPTPQGISTLRGRCFEFAVPAGWQVAEDGQFAVVLFAPDRCALTLMTGNSGLPLGYPPGQFVAEKLAAFQYPDLRLCGGPRPHQPMPGFEAAWQFDYAYSVNGVPCRGVAACHVRTGYGYCDLVVTAAASTAGQWPAYAGWLPQVAQQSAPLSSAAFGAAGIGQQNLANSIALGEHARQHREWSQRTWDEVARQRNASQDRQQYEFRQAMGNAQRYDDPYTGQQVDLSATNAVYWTNPYTGQVVASADPAFDPRTPTDANWHRMQPSRPPG